MISFVYNGTQYFNMDVDDEETYNKLCDEIGKENLDQIISNCMAEINKPSLEDRISALEAAQLAALGV